MTGTPLTPELDALVVGAGFAGLHMLHRLRSDGLRVRLVEAGDDVGGTWYWNRYPGARCDFESHDYSYAFDDALQREWDWTERYATRPEIHRYLAHVADRFGLRESIDLRTRVEATEFDESAVLWRVTAKGPDGSRTTSARWLILATGALSVPRLPDLPGLPSFGGRVLHTADWPHEPVDLRGKRAAVVGTGSSGVQVLPEIAEQADHVTVLQRTAGWVVPARNRPLSAAERQAVQSDYPAYRSRADEAFLGVHFEPAGPSALEATPAERTAAYESRWLDGGSQILTTYPDLLVNTDANATLADFLRGKIAEAVSDDATVRALTPSFPVGAKRIVVGTEYYELFERGDVELVDLRSTPLLGVTPTGLRFADGEVPVDVLVCATGFDALTGPLFAIDVQGRGGRALRDAWAGGPLTQLGLGTAGFPNLFPIAGPGSPSVMSNVPRCTELQVDWIADLIDHLRTHGLTSVEATPQAQQDWTAHVSEIAEATVLTATDSWYLGANVPGKPRVFMPYAGGMPEYRRRCADSAAAGYSGFTLT